MARTLQVVLVDDVDGGEAHQTVLFALDGTEYEIDLSDANAARLRADLAAWVGRARRCGRSARAPSSGVTGAAPDQAPDQAAVRAWARASGHTVNERGRLPAAVVSAYRSATAG